MSRSFWSLVLLLNPPSFASSGPSSSELLDRLNAAAQLSTLSDATLKPWHLRVEFDLPDPKGAAGEHGTLEEWWAAPDHFRIAIVSPSYTATETRDGDQSFLTRGQPRRPDLEEPLLSQVTDPLQRTTEVKDLSAIFEKKQVGKVNLDCIMPAPIEDPRSHTFLGQYTTYCFDPGQADLRVLIRYRDQFIVRNHIARFQNRNVALDLSVLDAGHLVLTSHVAQLTGYTPGVHDFEATPEQQAIRLTPHMSSAVMAGMLVKKYTPLYPQQARANHISGAVILHALIGKDGHVTGLSTIRSPDKLLTEAASNAVRLWVYKPYLLDGAPTEVETTITVNFNLG